MNRRISLGDVPYSATGIVARIPLNYDEVDKKLSITISGYVQSQPASGRITVEADEGFDIAARSSSMSGERVGTKAAVDYGVGPFSMSFFYEPGVLGLLVRNSLMDAVPNPIVCRNCVVTIRRVSEWTTSE